MSAYDFLMQRLAPLYDAPFTLSSSSPWFGIKELPGQKKTKKGKNRIVSAVRWNSLGDGNAVLCDCDTGTTTVFFSPGHVAWTHPSQPSGAPPAGIRMAVLLDEDDPYTKIKEQKVDTAKFAAEVRARGYLVTPPAGEIEDHLVWGGDLWPGQPRPAGRFIWARFSKNAANNLSCLDFSDDRRVCLGDAKASETRRYFDVFFLRAADKGLADLSEPARAIARKMLDALIVGKPILPPDPAIAAALSAWMRHVPQDVHSRRFIRMRLAAPNSGKSFHQPTTSNP